ncbi:nucleotide disphospho-sugar-binding domain-containing protein [Kitasatospora sp. NPDC091207]|uniref:nucleotide disphospho-sugar-binding domain-containing protein n=1 Tax=Kitasatospora sp. NPDC091207 TaxID=3364083 RepID=UPI003819ED8B
MRVLFVVFPSVSHLYPVVPLARALWASGHEVCVASHAGIAEGDMSDAIRATGLTAVPLGPREELHEAVAAHRRSAPGAAREVLAFDPQGGGDWRTVRNVLLGMFDMYYPARSEADGPWPMLDALVEFTRDWEPDLVLWDPLCPPAAVAAQLNGVPHARVLWGLDSVGWIHGQQGPGDDRFAEWIRPHLKRYGLGFSSEQILGQWSLDLVPFGTQLPFEGVSVPVRRVPYTGACTLPEWLHARPERPRVVLSLGMSARRDPEGMSGLPLTEILEKAAGRDFELVATLDPAELGSGVLPDNVRAAGYVPLDVLLPGASAVVHHGGGGTFAAAVAHRVPQIIVPVPKWDERVTGRYVQEHGAGIVLDRANLSVNELYLGIEQVVKDRAFSEGARALRRQSLALPGPLEAVALLERLTQGRSRR